MQTKKSKIKKKQTHLHYQNQEEYLTNQQEHNTAYTVKGGGREEGREGERERERKGREKGGYCKEDISDHMWDIIPSKIVNFNQLIIIIL